MSMKEKTIFVNDLDLRKKSSLSTVVHREKTSLDKDSHRFNYFLDGTIDENGISIFGLSFQSIEKKTIDTVKGPKEVEETDFTIDCLIDFASANYITISNGQIAGKNDSSNMELIDNNGIDVKLLENELCVFFELFHEHFFVDENGDFSQKELVDFYKFIKENHLEKEYINILQEVAIEYNKYFPQIVCNSTADEMLRPHIIFEQPEFIKKINDIRRSHNLQKNVQSSIETNIHRDTFERDRQELRGYVEQISHFINLKSSIKAFSKGDILSITHTEDLDIINENMRKMDEYAEKILRGTLTKEESILYKNLLKETTIVLEGLVNDFSFKNNAKSPESLRKDLVKNKNFYINSYGMENWRNLLHQCEELSGLGNEVFALLGNIRDYSKKVNSIDFYETQQMIRESEAAKDEDFIEMRTQLRETDEVAISVLNSREAKDLQERKRFDEIAILMERKITTLGDLEKFYYDLNTQSGGGTWLKHLEPTTEQIMQIVFGTDVLPEYLTKQEVFDRFEEAIKSVKVKEEELEKRIKKHNKILDSNITIKEEIYKVILGDLKDSAKVKGLENIETIIENEATRLAKDNFSNYIDLLSTNLFTTPKFEKLLKQFGKSQGVEYSIDKIPTDYMELKIFMGNFVRFIDENKIDKELEPVCNIIKGIFVQLETSKGENDLRYLNLKTLIDTFNKNGISVDDTYAFNADNFTSLYLIVNLSGVQDESIDLKYVKHLQNCLNKVLETEQDLKDKDILQMLRDNISNLNDMNEKDIAELLKLIDYISDNSQDLLQKLSKNVENVELGGNDMKQDLSGIIDKLTNENLAIIVAQDMFKRFTYLSDDYEKLIGVFDKAEELGIKSLSDNIPIERIGKTILEICTPEEVEEFKSRSFLGTINLRKKLLEEYNRLNKVEQLNHGEKYRRDRLLEALNYVDNQIVGKMLLGEKGFEHLNSETFKYLKIKEIKDQIIEVKKEFEIKTKNIQSMTVESLRNYIFEERNKDFISELSDDEKEKLLKILDIKDFSELEERLKDKKDFIYDKLKKDENDEAKALFDKYKEPFSEKYLVALEKSKKFSLFKSKSENIDIFRNEALRFANEDLAEKFVKISEKEKELQELFTNIQKVDKEFTDILLRDHQEELRYLGIAISKDTSITTDEAATSVDTNYIVAQLREKMNDKDEKASEYAKALVEKYEEMVRDRIEEVGLMPGEVSKDKKETESFLSANTRRNMKHTVKEIINGTDDAPGGVKALIDTINDLGKEPGQENMVVTQMQREAILYLLCKPNGLSLFREYYAYLKDGLIEVIKDDEQLQNLIGIEIFSHFDDKTKKEVFQKELWEKELVDDKFKMELLRRAYNDLNKEIDGVNILDKFNKEIKELKEKEQERDTKLEEVKSLNKKLQKEKESLGNDFFGELSESDKQAKTYISSLNFLLDESQKQKLEEINKGTLTAEEKRLEIEKLVVDAKMSLLTDEEIKKYRSLQLEDSKKGRAFILNSIKIDWDKLPEESKIEFAKQFFENPSEVDLAKAREIFERIVNPEVYESKQIDEMVSFIKSIEEKINQNEGTGEVKEPREIKSWNDLTDEEKHEFKTTFGFLLGNESENEAKARKLFDSVCTTIKPLEQDIREREADIIGLNIRLKHLREDLEKTKSTIDKRFEESFGLDFKEFIEKVTKQYNKANPEANITDDVIYSLKFEVLEDGTVKILKDDNFGNVDFEKLQEIVDITLNGTEISKKNIGTLIESADLTGKPVPTNLEGLFTPTEKNHINQDLKNYHLPEILERISLLTEEERISILQGPIGKIIMDRCQDFEYLGPDEVGKKHIVSQEEAKMIERLLECENSSEIYKAMNEFQSFREGINDLQATQEVLIYMFGQAGIGINPTQVLSNDIDEAKKQYEEALEQNKGIKAIDIIVETDEMKKSFKLKEVEHMRNIRGIIETNEKTPKDKLLEIATIVLGEERHDTSQLTDAEKNQILEVIQKLEDFNKGEIRIDNLGNSLEVLKFIEKESHSREEFETLALSISSKYDLKFEDLSTFELVSKFVELSGDSFNMEQIASKENINEGFLMLVKELEGKDIGNGIELVEFDGKAYLKFGDEIVLVDMHKLENEYLSSIERYGVEKIAEDTFVKPLDFESLELIKTLLGVEKQKEEETSVDVGDSMLNHVEEQSVGDDKSKEAESFITIQIQDTEFLTKVLVEVVSNMSEIKTEYPEQHKDVVQFMLGEWTAYNNESNDNFFTNILTMMNEELQQQKIDKEKEVEFKHFIESFVKETVSNPNIILLAEEGNYESIQSIIKEVVVKAQEEFERQSEIKELREQTLGLIKEGKDAEIQTHLQQQVEGLSRLELEELVKQLKEGEIKVEDLDKDSNLEKIINTNNADRGIGRTTIICDKCEEAIETEKAAEVEASTTKMTITKENEKVVAEQIAEEATQKYEKTYGPEL